MYGFGYSVADFNKARQTVEKTAGQVASQGQQVVSQTKQVVSHVQQVARQAQKSAEQAQKIVDAMRKPPVPRPPSPISSQPPKSSTSDILKQYAIPIAAVGVLIGVGLFLWSKK